MDLKKLQLELKTMSTKFAKTKQVLATQTRLKDLAIRKHTQAQRDVERAEALLVKEKSELQRITNEKETLEAECELLENTMSQIEQQTRETQMQVERMQEQMERDMKRAA